MNLAGDDDTYDETDGPVRMCIVTRDRLPDERLLRFVLDPQNHVVPDIHRKLPGRGVWVTATEKLLQQAIKRKAFMKGFRQNVIVGDDLTGLTNTLLRQTARQALSMANKAGQVVTGFAKVEQTVAAGDAAALVQASDGAEDGRRKLAAKFRAVSKARKQREIIIDLFSCEELSMALGRENVIHAAVRKSAASEKFLREAGRWLVFNGREPLGDTTQLSEAGEIRTTNERD